MPHLKLFLLFIFFISCNTKPLEKKKDEEGSVKGRNHISEKWDQEIFVPIIEGDTRIIQPGSLVRLKLFRKFTDISDSTDKSIIHEDKGYFVHVLDNPALPNHNKSWHSLKKYLSTENDTAYLTVPADSLFTIRDTIQWQAGYELIFSMNMEDTSYCRVGTWILNK